MQLVLFSQCMQCLSCNPLYACSQLGKMGMENSKGDKEVLEEVDKLLGESSHHLTEMMSSLDERIEKVSHAMLLATYAALGA